MALEPGEMALGLGKERALVDQMNANSSSGTSSVQYSSSNTLIANMAQTFTLLPMPSIRGLLRRSGLMALQASKRRSSQYNICP